MSHDAAIFHHTAEDFDGQTVIVVWLDMPDEIQIFNMPAIHKNENKQIMLSNNISPSTI